VEGCPVLRSSLERIFSARKFENNPPHFWARHFTALLQAAGFPGERAPAPEEFQARAKFDQILGEFSRLSLVRGTIPIQEALRLIRRLCADTLFQPESAEAPVQIMGILESAGLEFDCLWVSGLADEAWPLRARPNPFLPVALQKKAGIPEASAEGSLALDRRLTAGWLGAAREVVLSWPQKDGDRDLAASVLIGETRQGSLDVPAIESFRDLIFQSGRTETIPDGKAPPYAAQTVRGGTRVLADQAACPFRAFARHRLGAEALEAPAEGLDAMRRGQLLHELMKALWGDLKSQQGLQRDLAAVISRSAENAVDELGIEGHFARLEKERLIRLAGEWLEVERERAPFEVVRLEEKRVLEIAGLTLSGRIDRMDRLADGSHALIDYKTGRATPNDWLGERPEEPQLPLYAVSAKEDIGAVAFARLKTGEMRFMGFSRDKDAVPGVKQVHDWESLLSRWTSHLRDLAQGFAAGDARVDPKEGLKTCRNCDLHPLCRVHERIAALGAADGEDE